jgi:putative deacetylase
MHSQKGRQGVKIKWGESEEQYEKVFSEDTLKNEEFLKQIGVKPVCFAYPFGRYCKQSEKVLKNLGYKVTLTCEEGKNTITGPDSLFLMKRCNRTDKRCARYLLEKYK